MQQEIYKAKCDCGFSTKEMVFGFGQLDLVEGLRAFEAVPGEKPKPYYSFPFLCRSCESVSVGNYYLAEPKCERCGSDDFTPYDDETLHGEHLDSDIANSKYNEMEEALSAPSPFDHIAEPVLQARKHYCPKCNRNHLTFEEVGVILINAVTGGGGGWDTSGLK
jgi:RNA polymerase subunit RPABC4/transcription elongation factor Spt4